MVVCGDLCHFVVVCGSLRWFVLSYSHTESDRSASSTVKRGEIDVRGELDG